MAKNSKPVRIKRPIKDKQVIAYVTEEMQARLIERAQEQEITVSDHVRNLISRDHEEHPKHAAARARA